MLVDRGQQRIVSSIGWVDHGSLMLWEVDTGERSVLTVDDSLYLTLHRGEDDFFAVGHHSDATSQVTARHLDRPGEVLGRVSFPDLLRADLEGDREVWAKLPRFYRGRDPRAGTVDDIVAKVKPDISGCEVQLMEWRVDYDLLYQQMLDPVDARRDELVLIPVQRSSRVVIYDWSRRGVVGHIALPGSTGNPTLCWRTSDEIWADDYGTLAALSSTDWSVRVSAKLEPSNAFIGSWSFSKDRSACTLARPFSGDVLSLDCMTLAPIARADLGRQPLEAVALENGLVFARDWKTGDALTGRLGPV